MADYDPALSMPVTWAVKDNTFDDKDKNPKSISLFFPLESVQEFAKYLMDLADTPDKHRSAKVWDYKTNEAREVNGFYVNAKGKSGPYGEFGNITPNKLKNSELPF